ncbi:3'-5' exonuclease domain-containing protein [Perilla frutescens var. hirtella]|uniref:3'-5' exonuclease domain-containing protein n=1 Tax=Perilla frutescens var. hirtella TaxID=608512 RepID=A0AAD4JQQ1_PERFH|nr:3'-5' exonuclease domain-containing protein [Perilla frutescens var. hirtella]
METTVVHKPAHSIRLVTSNDSPEFAHLTHALTHSPVIGLDAEWKPNRQASTFPTVSLLQIACQLVNAPDSDSDDSPVFLIDLQTIHVPSVYELLKQVFASPDVMKLGFRFKQDLVYLSSTFCEHGCDPGFDRVEPFIDISAIYNHLQTKQPGRRIPKQTKSLATICEEVLGISISKELQCSDWSQRPLTEEQKAYAATDAHCLVDIFKVFHAKVVREGKSSQYWNKHHPSDLDQGLKQIFELSNGDNMVTRTKFVDASNMIRITMPELHSIQMTEEVGSMKLYNLNKLVDNGFLWIARKHGDKILLKDSDRKPKTSKKKAKRSSAASESKQKTSEIAEDWQGPAPWDPSLGGDGCPKFLCDVMIEGLAKHLRCVGIDAAIPHLRKPDTRDLIDQAQKEKRVLLTRDAKLLRHEYLIKNQIYRLKSLLKNDQLREVIDTFQLKISEDQLMTRCTKCNGKFIQKPLSTEEAVEAAKGFQVIPNCLFKKNLEFWQCMECNQLYWEGTQYHNAVQKFIDVCKLNEQPEGDHIGQNA